MFCNAEIQEELIFVCSWSPRISIQCKISYCNITRHFVAIRSKLTFDVSSYSRYIRLMRWRGPFNESYLGIFLNSLFPNFEKINILRTYIELRSDKDMFNVIFVIGWGHAHEFALINQHIFRDSTVRIVRMQAFFLGH